MLAEYYIALKVDYNFNDLKMVISQPEVHHAAGMTVFQNQINLKRAQMVYERHEKLSTAVDASRKSPCRPDRLILSTRSTEKAGDYKDPV